MGFIFVFIVTIPRIAPVTRQPFALYFFHTAASAAAASEPYAPATPREARALLLLASTTDEGVGEETPGLPVRPPLDATFRARSRIRSASRKRSAPPGSSVMAGSARPFRRTNGSAWYGTEEAASRSARSSWVRQEATGWEGP